MSPTQPQLDARPSPVPPPPSESRKRKSGVPWLLILYCSIFAALVVGVTIPRFTVLSQQRYELDETVAQTRILRQSTEQRQQTETDLLRLEDGSVIDTSILPEEDVITFIESIEALADVQGIEHHLQFNSSDRVVRRDIAEIPITLQLAGSWSSVFQFFVELEQEDYYVNPISIDVQRSATGEAQTAVFRGLSYWIPSL